ncbi:MAG: type II secretion system protein E [Polaromonas sp. 39-63-203]|jgi:general secretion pathway protein E|uniref:GspE/PulE family protein n=1 Tax=Polaromonas sp. TaxID=1869339 RepID=UPI000BD3324E|nr:type II/IV secretion system protein [Polaromonas sp.]OYZ03325.1 MAG: type II secretion system protein E [Polaromonas sp. 28-63-22]OYZ85146.1 MAG: type II secretion system protein E [Polaromonas sp. 24-62-144]OZB02453.1 MAG: type II secretion system protein E [Polaromonas sp. 39-63-203]HQS30608.1 ATPase, T2SS/T4P/T4SS family [Polaromonas sp.]HQS90030.1 ATPase, T2SS/T4P/T4SS family [Polaromonas sp.]
MSAVKPPHRPAIPGDSRGAKPYAGPLDWRRLVEWLSEDGVISPHEAERTIARCSQVQSAQHPLVRLASVSMTRVADGRPLDIETIAQWLAGRANLNYLRIDPLKVDVGKVADTMSAVYAERHKVLPVQVTPTEVVVATSEPFVTDWVSEVERQARRSVRLVVANPLEISKYTAEFFALAKSVKAALKSGGGAGSASFEQLVELNKTNKQLDANDQGVVQVVDWLWQYAFDQRASDIHLEPRREQGVIRFRIDGVLHPVYQMPMGVHNAMTARIKLLGRMDVVEKRRPQDGRIKTRNPRGDEIEMRLSTLPTAFGEKMVMRIFDPDTTVKDLDGLGFSQHDAERWEQLVKRPYGIVLVTGPTGSGKTTTLYSTLRRLATEEVNVSTIEDPIEMIEPAFNQTQVQAHLDFDFSEGLRALMRQDPDIIMVGEIRDLPTAEMAVQAALTGHLVFSTLHTNDAPSAVSRLMELGVPSYLINATLLGVLAQRLVRTLCSNCREPDEAASRETLADLVKPWQLSGGYRPYKPVGCVDCRMTGFRGRMGLYELLTVTEAFKEKVSKEPNIDALRRQAVREGMRPLRLAGALKVAEGMTTVEEILAATPPLS